MTTIQQHITGKFIEKLSESKNIDDEKLQKLRELLADTQKLPKADDFIKIFKLPAGGGNLK